MKGLPEDVAAGIPEDRETINEMDCYQLSGDFTKTKDIELVFKFETPYEHGEKVMLVVAILRPEPEEIEWLVWEGTGNADGDVEALVARADLIKIGEDPFIVIPVSEKK